MIGVIKQTIFFLAFAVGLCSASCPQNYTLVDSLGCFNFDVPDLVSWIDSTDYCYWQGRGWLVCELKEKQQSNLELEFNFPIQLSTHTSFDLLL